MTYTVSVSFLNAKILTTSHVPKVRKVMLSFPEGCKCNRKKNKLYENVCVLPFWFDQYWSIQINKVLRVRKLEDTDPRGVVTFSFQKKTIPVPVRQSWVSLSPLLASLQNPSPRKTFPLIRNGFLVGKTLQYRTCSLLKNLNFSAVHRTYLTF